MKCVLVTISGDGERAADILREHYADPHLEIVHLPRSVLESGSMIERLKAIRAYRSDIFAIATESIVWQYGSEALLLFGALSGASESIIIDTHGEALARKRPELLLKAPFRIARQSVGGRSVIRRAHKEIDRLESSILERPAADAGPGPGKQLSVAYFRAIPAPGTQPGGAASHTVGVIDGLVNCGEKVTVISNDELAGLGKDKLAFHRVEVSSEAMPRSAFDIEMSMEFAAGAAELVDQLKPDLIYMRYSRFSWAGVTIAQQANLPLFLEYNGSEVWVGRHWDRTHELGLLERIEKLNLAVATRIFVVSAIERDNLFNAGVPASKIVINPNGVDTDVFKPGIGGREVRNKLNINDDTVLVGFVGSFGPWHGVFALADAIAKLSPERNIHFLLIGTGALRDEMETRLRNAGCIDRTTFTGAVQHDEVPALLDACDILAAPHVPLADGSDFFGSPTKLFEYMAMGKAIVASRLGQIGDVLADDETALLVEPANADQICHAILKLAEDPSMRHRLGTAAREAALEKHTWKRNAQRVIDAFREICPDRT